MTDNLNSTKKAIEKSAGPAQKSVEEEMALFDFPMRDMAFANSEAFRLLQHQKGMKKSRWLFFPGCQLCASLPEEVKKTYALLQETLPDGVGVMLQCCGAPAVWSGCCEKAMEVWRRIEIDLAKMGSPTVIACCPGCYSILRKRVPGISVVFLSEIIRETQLEKIRELNGTEPVATEHIAAAYHDPCASRHDRAVQDSSRKLVENLGFSFCELPNNRENTRCCGYGELHYNTDLEAAETILADRIRESELRYITSCSNCRDMFASAGKDAWHLLELMWPSDKAAADDPGLDFSKRREVRKQLKKELSNGSAVKGDSQFEFRKPVMVLSDDIRALMVKGQILEEDIERTIIMAENSGRKIQMPDTRHYIASSRFSASTYWVEYSKDKGRYAIHDCYSHRIAFDAVARMAECGFSGRRMEVLDVSDDIAMPMGIEDAKAPFCVQCAAPMQKQDTSGYYLGETFDFGLFVCPKCSQVYVPDDIAHGSMLEIQRELEKKQREAIRSACGHLRADIER